LGGGERGRGKSRKRRACARAILLFPFGGKERDNQKEGKERGAYFGEKARV